MKIYAGVIGLVFIGTFLHNPTVGAGWLWDAGQGVGLVGLAGLIYLSFPGRPDDLKRHELLAGVVLLICAGHALWFLLIDGAVASYLKPGAPAYMWAGLASICLLFLSLAVSELPARTHVFKKFAHFSVIHRLLAIAALLGALYHVLASGYYFSMWYEQVLLIGLVTVAALAREVRVPISQTGAAAITPFILLSAITITAFLLIRNIAL